MYKSSRKMLACSRLSHLVIGLVILASSVADLTSKNLNYIATIYDTDNHVVSNCYESIHEKVQSQPTQQQSSSPPLSSSTLSAQQEEWVGEQRHNQSSISDTNRTLTTGFAAKDASEGLSTQKSHSDIVMMARTEQSSAVGQPVLPPATLNLAAQHGDSASNAKDQILCNIFKNYKLYERPTEVSDVAYATKPTIVTVNIHLIAITLVDVINMEYSADFYLRQIWQDPRLNWSRYLHLYRQFRNVTSFQSSSSSAGVAVNPRETTTSTPTTETETLLITSLKNNLWLADLFFRNGKQGSIYTMTRPNYLIRLQSSGQLLYSQKVTMRFHCQMNLINFPIDRQQCYIDIGSYGYTVDELKFVWMRNDNFTQEKNMKISEFNTPLDVKIIDCTDSAATSTGRYSCLKAIFHLERQLGYYLVVTYIPLSLIVMVSWLSFWVHIEVVPARITLGLLTLLAILTQGSGVMGSLPRVSYIKAIDIWIIACLLFVIGTMVEFAVASSLHKKRLHTIWEQEVSEIVLHELRMQQHYHWAAAPQTQQHVGMATNNFSNNASQHHKKRWQQQQHHYSSMPKKRSNKISMLTNRSNCTQFDSSSSMTATAKSFSDIRSSSTKQHRNLPPRNTCFISPTICRSVSYQKIPTKSPITGSAFIAGDDEEIIDSNLMEMKPITLYSAEKGPKKRIQSIKDSSSPSKFDKNNESLELSKIHTNTHINNNINKKKKNGTQRVSQSQDSLIDVYSRVLFPVFFLLYNLCYWLYYLRLHPNVF